MLHILNNLCQQLAKLLCRQITSHLPYAPGVLHLEQQDFSLLKFLSKPPCLFPMTHGRNYIQAMQDNESSDLNMLRT